MLEADAAAAVAREHIAKLKRGESVDGGLGKPVDCWFSTFQSVRSSASRMFDSIQDAADKDGWSVVYIHDPDSEEMV